MLCILFFCCNKRLFKSSQFENCSSSKDLQLFTLLCMSLFGSAGIVSFKWLKTIFNPLLVVSFLMSAVAVACLLGSLQNLGHTQLWSLWTSLRICSANAMNSLSKMILSSMRKLSVLFLNLFFMCGELPCSTEGKVSVGSWMQINRGFRVELGAIIFQSSTHFMLTN